MSNAVVAAGLAGFGFVRFFSSSRSWKAIGLALAASLLGLSGVSAAEPLQISEFMANNTRTLKDQSGNYHDWIEIYNSGPDTSNLGGWYLTDDRADLTKWAFPATNLFGFGYQTVFASGLDRTNAGAELHTNFKLSSAGGYLALVKPDGLTIASEYAPAYPKQDPDVSYGRVMEAITNVVFLTGTGGRVLVPAGDIGSGWVAPDFDDSTWLSATTGVGFNTFGSYFNLIGTDLLATLYNVNSSAYLRVPFVLTNVSALKELTLRMRYDDGFVAYLNGREVARTNAPPVPLWNGAATNSHDGNILVNFALSGSWQTLLREGTNLLAVQGLNRRTNSSNFLIAPELVSRDVTLLEDAPVYFGVASPGTINSTASANLAEPPSFSMPGGAYTNNLSLELRSSQPGAVIRYTLNGTEPTIASTIYSAPLILSATTVVRARAFVSGWVTSAIATECYSLLGSDVAGFTSNLPLVIIDTFSQSIVQSTLAPARFRIIDTMRGRSSIRGEADFDGWSGMAIRGSSSSGFPKKQYHVTTWDERKNEKKVSILGMPAESDWVLYAPYAEKSLMQNFLAYELSRKMGNYASRTKFVEVFIHSGSGKLAMRDYVGVYIWMEKIKQGPDRVNITKIQPWDNTEPNLSGGYIIKKDRLGPGETGIITPSGHVLGWVEPKENQATPAQKAWLGNYLSDFEAALYGSDFRNPTNGYLKYIDPDSFVDQHWMVEVARNIDGFRLSNFMHKDRGGRLAMQPIWDWNLSFGNANYWDGWLPTGWYHDYPALLASSGYPWFGRLFQDPDFSQRYTDRWGQLRTNVFNASNIVARVDELTAYLDEAQVRNFNTWKILNTYVWPNWYIGTNYVDDVGWMKQWIQDRLSWIDKSFLLAPTFNQNGGPIAPGFRLEISKGAGSTYYTLDGSDPRLPGGAISPTARLSGGVVILSGNARVFARLRSPTNAWSPPTVATFVVATPRLAITEIMYHPADPPADSPFTSADFEYLELKNVGTNVLDLTGVHFTRGIQFAFTGSAVTNLAPGERVLVVKNPAAFLSRYGAGLKIAGAFEGSVDNNGERLTLVGRLQEVILDFTYQNHWYPITDGYGFSLVSVDETAPFATWGQPDRWRSSSELGGSPGQPDAPPPVFSSVRINELLSNGPGLEADVVELHNAGAQSAEIGGWFLTDDPGTPKKFRIPDGTIIPAGGFLTFDETAFNPGGTGFAWSSRGDSVYLFSGNAQTNLTGYRHGYTFGPAEETVTFGTYVTSVGEDHFVAQSIPTLGLSNAVPKVGPVVITEILYHPADVFTNGAYWDNTEDEYIELNNLTDSPVPLFDTSAPTNSWRLRAGVDYRFPPGIVLPPHGFLLLVNFDPSKDAAQLASFRARFGATPSLPLLGPYQGKLSNSGESVELAKPGLPKISADGTVEAPPYILVDKVKYSNAYPWPGGADGIGLSLQRKQANLYGNDPINWAAAAPNPGTPYFGGDLPIIVTQPQSVTAVAFQDPSWGNAASSMRVEAKSVSPLHYQWRFQGANVVGATNAILTLSNLLPKQDGHYSVVVFNAAGSVDSQIATLTLKQPPVITVQPQGRAVLLPSGGAGTNLVLTVTALGTGPLAYQWRLAGTNLPGATAPTLPLTVYGLENAGVYTVLVRDQIGPILSQPAPVTVLIKPVIVTQPRSQTALVGETVRLTVGVSPIHPSLPLGYRWRRNGVGVGGFNIGNPDLILTNVQLTGAGSYSVLVTNAATSASGILSSPATVTVLADSDGDHMDDDWELAHGLNPADPSDAMLDSDGDGMRNFEEYIAGTDPRDAQSYLKMNAIAARPGFVTLQFVAVSNKTYGVQWKESVETGQWQTFTSVSGGDTNRTVTVIDPRPPIGRRIYRLVTPQ